MKRFVLEILGCATLAGGLAFAQGMPAHTAASRLNVWLVSPRGNVDGMLLRDGRSFFFSPEVARTLTLSVRINDPVRIDVESGQRYLVDERDDSRVALTTLAPARGGGPVGIPALQRVTATGEIVAFLRSPEGNVSGFILGTGEQVRVPPAFTTRINSLRIGDRVAVDGLGTRGEYGTGVDALRVTNARGNVLVQR